MTQRDEDEAREERIMVEIVVDCYDEDERAMGWETYLGETLQFPFQGQCIETRRVSPRPLRTESEDPFGSYVSS